MIKEAFGVLSYYMPPPLNKFMHKMRGVKFKDLSTTWIGFTTLIDNAYPEQISIGENVTISVDVKIFAHTEPPLTIQEKYLPKSVEPVVVGDNVFIGIGACILPGVTIGNDVIIGAYSVVTKDIPAYSVVAGSPARVIKDIRELNK